MFKFLIYLDKNVVFLIHLKENVLIPDIPTGKHVLTLNMPWEKCYNFPNGPRGKCGNF